ncbi:MAG: DUF5060 domain-containing protein [Bacteroidia bacterium]|nr:DUF5060 domain-containing protein [Bacteroidia bacterium]
MRYPFLKTIVLFAFIAGCLPSEPIYEVRQWEKITLSFDGPPTGEQVADNPFLNYRLTVRFRLGEKTIDVPGFYAADGNAAESSDSTGAVWQVRFRPDAPGDWSYETSFRQGENIAVSDDPQAGKPTAFDGQKGLVKVQPAAEGDEGKIRRVAGHYLQYAGSGRYFLKGGADSPENFLAYTDFDGTYRGEIAAGREGEANPRDVLHRYEPHAQDWREGDPTWQGGKGKNIIGALNYLASKGMNSVYFLTMNISGDGKDVWPYTSYEERTRFDCSKLDQWEMVFDHMDHRGLMLHVVTQETENEKLLDNGDTGLQRKLYYRELIARFGHHRGVTWNMGEENGPASFSPNGQSHEQRQAMVAYMKNTDPWDNLVVIHTHSNDSLRHAQFTPLLGNPNMDGPSIQVHNPAHTHTDTKHWVTESAKAGYPWVVCLDEIGPANRGLDPDDRSDNNQDAVRKEVLWGNLMAGGAGVEWYFGYLNPHNDLGCEDWRSRDRMWDYTRYALDFFQKHLPFHEMKSADEKVSGEGNYVFAKEGELYAIYLSSGGMATLNLAGQTGTFSVQWYNPRSGGELQSGSVKEVVAGSVVSLGEAPSDPENDWAILLQILR